MPPRLPRPATLHRTLRTPPDPGDDIARLRTHDKRLLQCRVLVVGQVLLNQLREELRLDEGHGKIIRQ